MDKETDRGAAGSEADRDDVGREADRRPWVERETGGHA